MRLIRNKPALQILGSLGFGFRFGFSESVPCQPPLAPAHNSWPASLRRAHGDRHARAGRHWRPGDQPRRRHGGAGLAQHLRLQHVLLPGLAVGGRDLLRAHPSPGRFRRRPADGRARPVALWAKRPPVHALGWLGSAPARRRDGGGGAPPMGGWIGRLGSPAWRRLARAGFGRAASRAPKWLRRFGLAAFFAVVLQGVLGGLRVVLFKDAIGIFHATLAQLFFVLVCAIALFTSRWWQTPPAPLPSTLNSQAINSLPAHDPADPRATDPGRGDAASARRPGHSRFPARLRQAVAGDGCRRPSRTTTQQRIEVVAANPITAFQIGLQMVHRLLAVCDSWRGRLRRLVHPARARREESF